MRHRPKSFHKLLTKEGYEEWFRSPLSLQKRVVNVIEALKVLEVDGQFIFKAGIVQKVGKMIQHIGRGFVSGTTGI